MFMLIIDILAYILVMIPSTLRVGFCLPEPMLVRAIIFLNPATNLERLKLRWVSGRPLIFSDRKNVLLLPVIEWLE